MDIYSTIFEVIDMRSFSNLWFWIALAVVWSTASHWVLGVPYDMIMRARRRGGEALDDLEDLVRINVKRMLAITTTSGLWILGFIAFGLTMLCLLAFVYGVEFAQALFLLGLPLSIVGAMAVAVAQKITTRQLAGDPLIKALLRHRFWTQIVGIGAIFVTALWGMYQNLQLSVF